MGYAGYKFFSRILQLLFFLDVLLKPKNMRVQALGELVNVARQVSDFILRCDGDFLRKIKIRHLPCGTVDAQQRPSNLTRVIERCQHHEKQSGNNYVHIIILDHPCSFIDWLK
ncbi:hypothetical protein D3C77_591580 [compost metagenome]